MQTRSGRPARLVGVVPAKGSIPPAADALFRVPVPAPLTHHAIARFRDLPIHSLRSA